MPQKRTTIESQQQLTRDLGVARQTISDWIQNHGLQTNKDGEFILRVVIDEFFIPHIERMYERKRKANEKKNATSKYIARQEELKIAKAERDNQLAELRILEKVRALIPRDTVKEVFMRSAARYKQAGELLAKHHGEEAREILTDAIEAVSQDLENLFSE